MVCHGIRFEGVGVDQHRICKKFMLDRARLQLSPGLGRSCSTRTACGIHRAFAAIQHFVVKPDGGFVRRC